jgi:hypothetical protein
MRRIRLAPNGYDEAPNQHRACPSGVKQDSRHAVHIVAEDGPRASGDLYTVTIQIEGGSRFYRLRQQFVS